MQNYLIKPMKKIVFLALLQVLFVSAQSLNTVPVKVAAASDLRLALGSIADDYFQLTGQKVQITYGSSGNFYRQIMQGGPFDLLMSADESYVQKLNDQKLTQGPGHLYAKGRIVLFIPQGAKISLDPELKDFKLALLDGRIRKVAIANPVYAPYGRVAQEILEKIGVWDKVQSQLVLGDNVAQATEFAISGNVQAGFIPFSATYNDSVRKSGTWVVIPESLHSPILQRLAILKGANAATQRLYDYLLQPQSQRKFQDTGFQSP